MKLPDKAQRPTFYFIGVTTAQSAIMNLFPLWAKELGLKDTVIKGIDIGLHADPEQYREVVRFLKDDPLSKGALVTTHKLDLYAAAHDLFNYLDPYAQAFAELSCISKQGDKLAGHAKDPISSGLAIESFLEPGFWDNNHGEAFLMGAGGSAIAIASYLLNQSHGSNLPAALYVTDLNTERLAHMEAMISPLQASSCPVTYIPIKDSEDNESILSRIKPYSLVVNATGLGKDRPGSPLPDTALFPPNSHIWELNYRGELLFLRHAERQQGERKLTVHDGWTYFIHGWTQVIAEVFSIEIKERDVERLKEIAWNYMAAGSDK